MEAMRTSAEEKTPAKPTGEGGGEGARGVWESIGSKDVFVCGQLGLACLGFFPLVELDWLIGCCWCLMLVVLAALAAAAAAAAAFGGCGGSGCWR